MPLIADLDLHPAALTAIAMLITGTLMRLWSEVLHPKPGHPRFRIRGLLWIVPIFTQATLRRSRSPESGEGRATAVRMVLDVLGFLAAYTGLRLASASVSETAGGAWWLGYLAIFPMILLIQSFSGFYRLIGLGYGVSIPPIHIHPLGAPTLTAFWARRWNTWVHDWFEETVFLPLRRRLGLHLALLAVFTVSGLWHEAILNLPVQLTGVTVQYGGVTAYFILQWIGIGIERAPLHSAPSWLKRAWTWVIAAGPAPLVLNESALRILGLWSR